MKRIKYIFVLFVLSITACAFSGIQGICESDGINKDTQLKNRDILLDIKTKEDLGGIKQREDQSYSLCVDLDSGKAKKAYAVVLFGASQQNMWSVVVNDQMMEKGPVYSDSEAWHLVPTSHLKQGQNEIKIVPFSKESSPLDRILAFSLFSPVEEDYFEKVVLGTRILVQPATHPDQDKMDVLHCKIAITLNMSAANITSACLTLTAESLDSSLDTCVLDLNDNYGSMIVSAVDSGEGTPGLSYTHDGGQDRLFITLPGSIPVGNQFTVRVYYSGTPASSPFRRNTHSGVPVIYTNSQAYNARKWWPCKDIPGDKFTAEIIIRCPDTIYNGYPLFAVSNGKLISQTNNGDGTLTYHWDSTNPIASQYVSIACSNYHPAAGLYTALDTVTTMPVVHYVYPESYASESQELPRTIEVMEHFASKFGEYPFLSEKYCTATWGLSYGMEHQTCTSMPNGNLNNPPYHRRNVHELAHMWFGVALGIAHFDHLWISEGWATYCEALWKEHKWGVTDYHNQMNSWSTSDAYPIVSSNADNFYLPIVYYKGAWVLHMLRHVIGDAAFFAGAKNYCEDLNLRYKTAWSSDLQGHFEATYGSSLSWFFDSWLYQANRPNYEWWWRSRTVGSDTYIDIGIEQIQSGGNYTMPIDFRVEFQGGGTADFTVWNNLSPQTFSENVGSGTVTNVTIDPDGWVLDYNTQVAAPSGIPEWREF